jgi:hypothetical protein
MQMAAIGQRTPVIHHNLADRSQRVESNSSKKLEAVIPSGCTDSLFIKLPPSGMAEKWPSLQDQSLRYLH